MLKQSCTQYIAWIDQPKFNLNKKSNAVTNSNNNILTFPTWKKNNNRIDLEPSDIDFQVTTFGKEKIYDNIKPLRMDNNLIRIDWIKLHLFSFCSNTDEKPNKALKLTNWRKLEKEIIELKKMSK